jgi:poly(3-hydroxybutyrate) depolymerase
MRTSAFAVASVLLFSLACTDAGAGGGGESAGSPSGSAGTTNAGAASVSGGASGTSGASGNAAGGSSGQAGAATVAGQGGMGAAGTGGTGSGGAEVTTIKSSGCGTPRTLQDGSVTVQSNGMDRTYILSVPDDYDENHPYRLVLSYHGATGNGAQVAADPGAFFGLRDLSEGSTIFIAPYGLEGFWYNEDGQDVTFTDDILEQVEADLCIDIERIALEGFSMGGAMVYTLACARPDVFSAVVVHSGGGLPRPTTCQPIAYLSSLGAEESAGAGQTSNSDFFALTNGCTVETLPDAPAGSHVCTNYQGCSAGYPVRWCPYDGGHTPAPTDVGQDATWMPQEVWTFLTQF